MMAGDPRVERTHIPGDSFAVNLSDETAEGRDGVRMFNFVEELREVANRYGFDIQTWGPTDKFVRAVAPAYMEKVWVMRDE